MTERFLLRDESAEMDAAVITVEESAGKRSGGAPGQRSRLTRLNPLGQVDRDDVEIGCPITCGDCKALLLMKKFVCPGINVKCVKVGNGCRAEPPPAFRVFMSRLTFSTKTS